MTTTLVGVSAWSSSSSSLPLLSTTRGLTTATTTASSFSSLTTRLFSGNNNISGRGGAGGSSTQVKPKKKNKAVVLERNRQTNNKTKKNDEPSTATTTTTRGKQASPSKDTTTTTATPKQQSTSIGQSVQDATSVEELLDIAAQQHFWLPTDVDLPSHLRLQKLHHERRQRWSAQLLSKLGDLSLLLPDNPRIRSSIWDDARLGRAVLAAALPFPPDHSNNNSYDKERRAVRDALVGLHTLAGHATPSRLLVHEDIRTGLQLLLERAEAISMADEFSLPEALEVRWAARGLVVRIPGLFQQQRNDNDNDNPQLLLLSSKFPSLDSRVQGLPFDILPLGIDFSNLEWLENNIDNDNDDNESLLAEAVLDRRRRQQNNNNDNNNNIMTILQENIPFQFDTIVTRHGKKSTERRGTAWVAENGVGALAYSGKLMPPAPMPSLVRAIMRQVERAIFFDRDNDHRAPFFDCALCNFYPTQESACQFHTDPEHGTMWERLNCVVAVGYPRRFAFRPIPEVTTWDQWDKNNHNNNNKKIIVQDDTTNAANDNIIPAVIRVFPGDIVQMWGTCNDDFHHAVYPESVPLLVQSTCEEAEEAAVDLRRVSLVLKRAMVNGSKRRRGHSLAGEGRRNRRNKLTN